MSTADTPFNYSVTNPRLNDGHLSFGQLYLMMVILITYAVNVDGCLPLSQETGEEVVQGVRSCFIHRPTHEDFYPGT